MEANENNQLIHRVLKNTFTRILVTTLVVTVSFFFLFYYWTGNYFEKMIESRKRSMVEKVTIARNTVEPIIDQVRQGKLTKAQGLDQVRKLIRRMVYTDYTGKNYIFMSAYDGTMLVQPFEPHKENTNQWNLQDSKGKHIVRELIASARTHPQGGFVTYHYLSPASDQVEEKISYVVGIPELEAYIGTGMYMEQVTQERQAMFHRAMSWSTLFVILLIIPVLMSLYELYNRNRILEHEMAERKKVQAALADSEERLSLALDSVNDGVWDWRAKTGFTFFSPRWYTMLGYQPNEFPATYENWKNLVHPQEIDRVEQKIRQLFNRDEDVYTEEYRMKTKTGSWRWILTRGRVVSRDPDGNIIRLIGTHTDISDRKAAEDEIVRLNAELEERVRDRTAQLEVANKELESFSYSVSHDLHAPLRGINGFSAILQEEYAQKLGEEGMEHLNRIRQASVRMGLLIDGLLCLARTTRSEIHRQNVDLSSMVKDLMDEIQRENPSRQVELTVAPNLEVHGDPQLLRIVMMNLLNNAWKFTSRREVSRIEVDRLSPQQAESFGQGGRTVFYVRDNGVGFDMEYVGKLFKPFQRLHRADEFSGTGLGLATVQRIIHRHGGTIWVESKENEGTTFYFTLS